MIAVAIVWRHVASQQATYAVALQSTMVTQWLTMQHTQPMDDLLQLLAVGR